MLEKPCERAARGCRERIVERQSTRLARRRFCSLKCAYLARVEAGWRPKPIPRGAQSRGGRVGGLASGLVRREQAMLRTAERLLDLFGDVELRQLTDRQRARFKVLLVQAWRRGYTTGCRKATEAA
jgi:hypothetical protein